MGKETTSYGQLQNIKKKLKTVIVFVVYEPSIAYNIVLHWQKTSCQKDKSERVKNKETFIPVN